MEPFLGQIQAFGFNFPPRGWSTCEGQILPINQNQALFALLGTTYGGDGRTTFALPDLRSRSMVGVGTGAGLDAITQGERGGVINHTMQTTQMPSHNHSVSVGVNTGPGEEDISTGVISNHNSAFNEDPSSGTTLGDVSENSVGNSQAFNIRNPFLGIYVCIALTGIFPSRN